MENWVYNDFINSWFNIDKIFYISIVPGEPFWSVRAVLEDGNFVNIWHGDSKEEAEDFLINFMNYEYVKKDDKNEVD